MKNFRKLTKLTDLLAVFALTLFLIFILHGIAISIVELGFNPKLTTLVITILSVPSLLGFIAWLGNFIAKRARIPARVDKITMEQYLYKQDNVQQIAYETSNFFRIAMKNKALTRVEILEFKEMLDNSLHEEAKKYKSMKFENDCHEIYTKLKSNHILLSDMEALKDYIMPFALAYIVPVENSQEQSKYKHLKVVK